MGYLILFTRCLVGGVLLVSAAAKLRDRREFAESLHDLRLVAGRLRGLVAIAVIAAEFAVAALIALPWTAAAGLGAATVMLTAFAMIAIRAAGRSVPCRCFGGSRVPLGTPHGMRNLALAFVSAAGGFSLLTSEVDGLAPLGAATTVVAALVGIAVTAFFDDLVELFSPATPRLPHPKGR